MTILSQPHELTWGSLVCDSVVEPDVAWRCETLAAGSSFGAPVPLVEVVQSWLADGSLATVTRWGNRRVSFRVRLSAPDGLALAQAEAAFMAEVTAERPSPLVWTPPAFDGWPAVYDVVAVVEFGQDFGDGWDFDEKYRLHRFYTVTLECLPWVHPLDKTVIPAIPAPVDPATPASFAPINTADSTQNWTGRHNPVSGAWSSLVLSATGGYVRYSGTLNWNEAGNYPRQGLRYDFGTLVTDPTRPYLYIEFDITPTTPTLAWWLRWNFNSNSDPGTLAEAPVGVETLANGNIRAYWEVPTQGIPVINSVLLDYEPVRPGTASATWSHRIDVYEIGLVDKVAIVGTNGFQVARTAQIGGTAPTQAAIRFDAGADPLVGTTAMVYTGGSPVVPLRPLLTSSATVTVDATKISGAYNDLSVATKYVVPISRLSRAGYTILARLNGTGDFTVSWTAKIVSTAGALIPGSEVVESGDMLCSNPVSNGDPWMIHVLGKAPMPVVATEGDVEHAVEVSLSMATGGASVQLDAAWLCDTDTGAVTVIYEPSANQLSAIELRSPQVDSPVPEAVGTWITYGIQNIDRLVTDEGTHEIRPGTLHVYTATDLAQYAECSLELYERFHTYPGPGLPTTQEEV